MTVLVDRIVPWIAYPATITFVIVFHLLLLGAAQPITISSYIPVLTGAVLVTLLEIYFPQEKAWQPPGEEIRNDILYMILVQIALPKLLTFAVVLMIAIYSQAHPTMLWDIWPHEGPVWMQAVLMILLADFLRYWLHVASHNVPLLWRFHAVHHSPHRLYWLNVGRFHPIEKAVQFLFDSLPFIVLGVKVEVLALYFVFYSVNGFFQHSNIKLRYGILNYLISGAELHRWHHSCKPKESNSNYGNNIIIWDLLFGTWFLPGDRKVGELGLVNRYYPLHFWKQLGTPFTPDIVYRDVPLQHFSRVVGRWLSWFGMQWIYLFHWRQLQQFAREPEHTQQEVLLGILQENQNTRFGREHDFSQIKNYQDFVQYIPVQDYEMLRPYISEQEMIHAPALTRERPFMYAITSGTTGESKYIPVLHSTIADYRQEQQLSAWSMYKYCPMAFTGKVFGLAGPAVEGIRESGIPFGSVSGQLYAKIPRLMQINNVLPYDVYNISDPELKYRVIMRFALAEPQITQAIGANPSSFLRLLTVLNNSRDSLEQSLAQGTLTPLGDFPADIAHKLSRYIKPVPERARQLHNAPHDRELNYADFWPELRLITLWTGGSCGIALKTLQGALPEITKVMELGYLASELHGTITVNPESGGGVPTLHHHFFEFIEPSLWESGDHHFLRLHELKEGNDYYIIVTTRAGLYRYFMNDIVRVVGKFKNTPTLCFMQKGRGVTNITGEKLYESQLLQAVQEVADEQGIETVFVMCLADEQENIYRLYIEAEISGNKQVQTEIAAKVDLQLAKLNIEYKAKRETGRLLPLQLYWLEPGTGEAYKKHCVENGQREGQFKIVSLQMCSQYHFDLEPFVMEKLLERDK